MGTSTGNIAHGSELHTEGPESGHGELIVTVEHNTNDAGETNTGALPNGKVFIEVF
jgi:hypothetical protein